MSSNGDVAPQRCPACAAGLLDISGVEIRGEHDGVLLWECLRCGHAWHRWSSDHPLHARAEPYVQRRLADPDRPE